MVLVGLRGWSGAAATVLVGRAYFVLLVVVEVGGDWAAAAGVLIFAGIFVGGVAYACGCAWIQISWSRGGFMLRGAAGKGKFRGATG